MLMAIILMGTIWHRQEIDHRRYWMEGKSAGYQVKQTQAVDKPSEA